jgi:aspartate/methionine/tyrosine aminotransferase
MNIPLSPFKLERYFARYEFSARYLLCSSDCESLAVQDLLALEPEADEGLSKHWLGYTESLGAPSLRHEISRIYTTIQPDQVLVHSGAEEAIFLFMHAALQPGDHIIVHSPCYQSLSEVALSLGCQVTAWNGKEQDRWMPDLAELTAAIRPNTRVIVVNTPHNPTGLLMQHQEFLAINQIARQRGIILFSDEVYRESEHDASDRLPAACDINDLAVSLGVMSKTYGLAGLRIGWIATHNADLYARMAHLKDYTTICSSAPSEYLAELALRHREKLARRNLDIIAGNLAILDRFFAAHPDQFSWVRPKAGSIAFPKLIGEDIDNFCHQLVTAAGVLLLPGTIFDDRGNHFRIGFGRKNMPGAVAHLEEFLHGRSRPDYNNSTSE